jgi:integrase/recombinase XerD
MLVGLLYVTGMRVGEAIRLDRTDVDLPHGILVVRNSEFGAMNRELMSELNRRNGPEPPPGRH